MLVELDPAPEVAAKPKRARKPPDYSKLVLRNGRLTRAFWLLREGLYQDVRHDYVPGYKGNDWRTARYIIALTERGWLEQVKGPRKGQAFRTTGDGAFALLAAECQPAKP